MVKSQFLTVKSQSLDGWIAILLVKSRFSLVDVQIVRWTTAVESLSGHENYHLRLTAGSAPPSDLAAKNQTEEMEKLIQRAGEKPVFKSPVGWWFIWGFQGFTMILFWMGF